MRSNIRYNPRDFDEDQFTENWIQSVEDVDLNSFWGREHRLFAERQMVLCHHCNYGAIINGIAVCCHKRKRGKVQKDIVRRRPCSYATGMPRDKFTKLYSSDSPFSFFTPFETYASQRLNSVTGK